jgi:hypothetical protein
MKASNTAIRMSANRAKADLVALAVNSAFDHSGHAARTGRRNIAFAAVDRGSWSPVLSRTKIPQTQKSEDVVKFA